MSAELKPEAPAKDRVARFAWLAERRLVAHNPSLARQASTDAK
jgi:primosomal protein N''